jgi:hypothetical protein
MARFAIIQGGLAVNIIEAEADFAASIGAVDAGNAATGDLYADGVFSKPPVDLPVARIAAWEAIKVERERRESGGVKVGDKWFHTDADSRIKQLGLVLKGAGIPAGLQWKTMDGSFVTMTQTLAGQIFDTSLSQTSAIYVKAEQHKAAMEASADPAGYDFSGGWPAVYGE